MLAKICLNATVAILVTVATRAHAGEPSISARCQAIAAKADARAALLRAPELTLQGLRVPRVGDVDGTQRLVGEGFQARVALGFAPLDLWRAGHVVSAAEAACEREQLAERLEQVVAQGTLYGKAAALRAQAAQLAASRERVDALVAAAEARLARGLSTVVEVDELRLRRLRLRRHLAELRDELRLLEEAGHDRTADHALAALVSRYQHASLEVDRSESALRGLDAWQLQLRAGVVPGPDDRDWFGLVEVSYDLGQLWQRRAERRYLEAREEQLRTDEGELARRVERFQRAMRASATELAIELRLLEAEIDVLGDERAAMRAARGAPSRTRLAVVELQLVELEARRRYLETLIRARHLLEKK